jgi:hypothetical protein
MKGLLTTKKEGKQSKAKQSKAKQSKAKQRHHRFFYTAAIN